MTERDRYKDILDDIFFEVNGLYEKRDLKIFDSLSNEQKEWIKTLVEKIEKQKSVVAVTITSLLKKIESPNQDVRLHRNEFESGYSGRSLDTNVVTPWLKEHFTRFAPKESGWLTRSIEQSHPFTMDFPGKIQDKVVKKAFLSILDDVEEHEANPKNYLSCLLLSLIYKYVKETTILSNLASSEDGLLTIDIVVSMLEEHFSMEISSRLPVVAVYSIYQLLMKYIKVFDNKDLILLKGHTTSDRYTGFGDIEVFTKDGDPFEIVEVKHNKPIDKMMIEDVLKKIEKTRTIKRYYVLTTAEHNFSDDEVDIIFDMVHKIKATYDVEIIPNGIIPSIKYYLRFVPDLREFIDGYAKNLGEEFKKNTDVKEIHINKWVEIRKKHHI